ncbi:hypothetical protein KL86PLE_100120 [uncultured Pleomorphomonas sp.]|uniref:Uncharacterized protein n=1 Tax=uncultured Pleomorphomonas sp. TaxID=442121 RepID=A0A212L1E6_9HYPH|nr:hypothetical protein KL86PLE_100120 [uncultured Pleomorphomonas sp.]
MAKNLQSYPFIPLSLKLSCTVNRVAKNALSL